MHPPNFVGGRRALTHTWPTLSTTLAGLKVFAKPLLPHNARPNEFSGSPACADGDGPGHNAPICVGEKGRFYNKNPFTSRRIWIEDQRRRACQNAPPQNPLRGRIKSSVSCLPTSNSAATTCHSPARRSGDVAHVCKPFANQKLATGRDGGSRTGTNKEQKPS